MILAELVIQKKLVHMALTTQGVGPTSVEVILVGTHQDAHQQPGAMQQTQLPFQAVGWQPSVAAQAAKPQGLNGMLLALPKPCSTRVYPSRKYRRLFGKTNRNHYKYSLVQRWHKHPTPA
jgi:hypothetical protein